jgi:hypothetical protein
MTRVLELTGPRASMRFTLLWTTLMAGGDGKGERTPVVIRKEARLHDAFEQVSLSVPRNGGPPQRELIPDGGVVTLSQEDFELLQQYSEKTQWTPAASRDVVDLWDFLSVAEKRD